MKKECQERRNGQRSIQIFHQFFALYLMEKNCQFLCKPESYTLDSDDDHDDDQDSVGPEPSTLADPQPHLISQSELNDLVRNLEWPKSKPELLSSRLQQWNLLEKDASISLSHNHHKDLVQFFLMEGLVYCNDIDGLMASLRITHDPDEWRLFIDSSKTSLKAVFDSQWECFVIYSSWPCSSYERDI